MQHNKFLDSLLPSFERAKVKEDLVMLRDELKTVVLPVYDSAAKSMKNRTFLSKQVIEFEKDFKENVDTAMKGNFVVVIDETLRSVYENIDMIEGMVEKYYSEDIYRDAMTYLKINILQYVEAISFASRYSRSLLLWVYACEVNMVENNVEEMGNEMTEGERAWLRSNAKNFFSCMTILSMKRKDAEKKFEEIPDIVATDENNEYLPKTVGQTRLDPFMFGFIQTTLNPIYHVRMAWTEWQVNRYRASIEEKRMLEFRILQMKQLESGKQDPKIAEQLEYTSGRLQKLNYKINKMENPHG